MPANFHHFLRFLYEVADEDDADDDDAVAEINGASIKAYCCNCSELRTSGVGSGEMFVAAVTVVYFLSALLHVAVLALELAEAAGTIDVVVVVDAGDAGMI